ncbi:cytochrome C oxidase subunit IV family protein [Nocardioides sp. J54]|uniref:cytochrome C oxidase subunit IV family protein n=1 Tax=Nocardioides sp. J54 TaxID=935866 RepID=UPI0004919118|nr:cytochrome C oxidase subunit IV family protein [Nocardioides sp. J54]
MTELLQTRTTAVWAALAGVTVLSWAMGSGMGISDVETAGVVILLISLVKVRFVLSDFMEVRTAPLWLGRATDAWLAALGIMMISRFLIG